MSLFPRKCCDGTYICLPHPVPSPSHTSHTSLRLNPILINNRVVGAFPCFMLGSSQHAFRRVLISRHYCQDDLNHKFMGNIFSSGAKILPIINVFVMHCNECLVWDCLSHTVVSTDVTIKILIHDKICEVYFHLFVRADVLVLIARGQKLYSVKGYQHTHGTFRMYPFFLIIDLFFLVPINWVCKVCLS